MHWLCSIFLLAASAADLYRQGVAAFQRGAHDQALAPLSRAVELEPKNAGYRKALGAAYAAQGMYPQAEEQFGAACRLDPSVADVCYYHARALYAINRFEPALEVLGKLKSKGVREYAALAQAEEALGRVQEAEKNYHRACEDPRASTARLLDPPCLIYGVFLFRQGRLNEALRLLDLATKENPKHPRAHFELGRALYQADSLPGAVEHLQSAVHLGYGDAAALLLDKARRRLEASTAGPAR